MMPIGRLPARAALPIAGGALAISLACGLLVPIYTDEVAWRFQLSRAPFDGGFDRGLGDQCGPATTLAAPWFLQPMRHLAAGAEYLFADPRTVRLLGVALAFAGIGLIAAIARATGRRDARTRLALGLGLLGLGTTPWLLVWSRPEQPILLMLATAILLALAPVDSPGAAWARAGAILACTVVALGYHPKAVVFAPVFVVALACSSRGESGRWARSAGIALIVALAADAFGYWNLRLACPGDPLIAARAAAESAFAASAAGGSRWPLIQMLAANVSPMGYVGQIGPGGWQMSHWLPATPLPHGVILGWFAVVALVWQLALLVLLAALLLGMRAAWTARGATRPLVLALALAACLLGWSALQSNKNAYEAALTLPLAAIALLLVLPGLPQRWQRDAERVTLGVALLAAASQAALIAAYVPLLARTAARAGTIAGQPFSFTAWGYPAARRDILAAGRSCGIDPVRAHDLLVDDLTYWPYMATWRPSHWMAILGPWRGRVTDPIAYMRARRSSGIVVQCAILPPALRARAKAHGQFCCLGPFDGGGA